MFSCLALLALGLIAIVVAPGGDMSRTSVLGIVLLILSFVVAMLLEVLQRKKEGAQKLENQILDAKIRKLEAKISLLEEMHVSEKLRSNKE